MIEISETYNMRDPYSFRNMRVYVGQSLEILQSYEDGETWTEWEDVSEPDIRWSEEEFKTLMEQYLTPIVTMHKLEFYRDTKGKHHVRCLLKHESGVIVPFHQFDIANVCNSDVLQIFKSTVGYFDFNEEII